MLHDGRVYSYIDKTNDAAMPNNQIQRLARIGFAYSTNVPIGTPWYMNRPGLKIVVTQLRKTSDWGHMLQATYIHSHLLHC